MKRKFLLYAIFISIAGSFASWSSLTESAGSGSGSGGSWRSGISGPSYGGSYSGGHK